MGVRPSDQNCSHYITTSFLFPFRSAAWPTVFSWLRYDERGGIPVWAFIRMCRCPAATAAWYQDKGRSFSCAARGVIDDLPTSARRSGRFLAQRNSEDLSGTACRSRFHHRSHSITTPLPLWFRGLCVLTFHFETRFDVHCLYPRAFRSGTLTALSSDGSPVWTISGINSDSYTSPIPDFSGGALLKTPYSYVDGRVALTNARVNH